MLNIAILDLGTTGHRIIDTVADMGAARAYVDDFASKCRGGGQVIDFEVDADEDSCANAAVLVGRNIKVFSIFPVAA